MAEATPAPQGRPSVSDSARLQPKRKGLVSPTSSFVDFTELPSEYFTPEGRELGLTYEPHINRQLKKPTTDFETCVHLLKGSVGAGILAMPKAFYHAGTAVGIIGTILLGTTCVYALSTLIRMQYIQCKRLQVPFLTLPRSMKIALLNGPRVLKPFAPLAPIIIDFFLVSYQIGICTAYIIFIAVSIKDLAEPALVKNLHLRVYLLMIFIPVVLINFIRNLKKLTPISLISNVLVVIALSACFFLIFFEGDFKLEDTRAIAPIETWPLFIGTVLFALEAVGVIIALEHNMKNPQNFLGRRGIFPWSLVFVVAMYMAVGLIGYLKYGSGVHDTIVDSLPSDHSLTPIITGVYAVCIYMSYPLQCYVSLEILWGNYLIHHIDDPNKECCIEYILRIVVVIITFVVAAIIPHVDIMISLVGAFCLSTLGMSFPFLMELCTLWPDGFGRFYFTFWKDLFFIVLGLCILVIGTYVTIHTFLNTK